MDCYRAYSLYKHTSPSGKVYIGITRQKPEKRWENGNGYKQCPAFWKAICKYGWNNFNHEILKTNLSKEVAEAEEIATIKKYKSTNSKFGYNIENGGNCCGTHSDATKKKISQANKGKIVSQKTREKIRIANTGKLVGTNNPFFGKHHTDEFKKAKSEFMKGNNYNKGNHHTNEFKREKSKQMHEKYKDGGNPRCKKVAFVVGENICVYFSMREAARKHNVSVSTVFKWINDANNISWRYYNVQT